MKLTFLAALLWVTIPQFSYSQTINDQHKITDSLKQKLQNEKQDSTRTKLLARLSQAYQDFAPDTALLLAQQGVALAKQIKFIKGEAKCLQVEGQILYLTGHLPEALMALLEALKKYEILKDQNSIAGTYGDIGNMYNSQQNYVQALSYYSKQKTIIEGYHGTRPDMINYYKKLQISNYIGIGDLYEKLNQFDSAIMYIQKAYDLAKVTEDANAIGTALNNFGNIYSKMDQFSVAINYYRLSLIYFRQSGSSNGVCESALGIAKMFKKSRQSDSTIYYAKLSMIIARNEGYTKNLFDASMFLTDYYKTIGNSDSALVYQSLSMDTKDSLFNQESIKKIQNLTLEELLRQQKIVEQKAKAADDRKNSLQLWGIAVFIVLSGLVLILIKRRKVRTSVIYVVTTAALLILFEFISLLIDPFIQKFTNHKPVYTLLLLVLIASVLLPLHHKLDKYLKTKKAK